MGIEKENELREVERKYNRVLSILFAQNLNQNNMRKFDITIRLGELEYESSSYSEFVFYDCVAIKIDCFAELTSLWLTIDNIKGHQLEGIRYKVSDVEDSISFMCRDYSSSFMDASE